MEYEIVYSKRKSIAAQIDRDGGVRIRAPYFCPRFVIASFVRTHQIRIEKQREKMLSLPPIPTVTRKQAEEMRVRTRDVVLKRLSYWKTVTGLSYGKVKITKARARFGSCSAKGDLCFSLFLCLLDEKLLDYVIVHELCHLKHHNHSPRFYRLVESFLPDRKERERALKNFVIPKICD